MKALVIGRTGQLATELARAQWPENFEATVLGRPELNVLHRLSIAAAIERTKPDIVINASAYTQVERAETEPDAACAINRDAPRALAEISSRRGIALIHLSTDYVFDGTDVRPRSESDPTNPQGMYARSKLEGEEAIRNVSDAHVIVRTSWLFASHGQNFVRTMLKLSRERSRLEIVDDQIGCPTPARDLASVVIAIANRVVAGKGSFGTFHYCGAGPVSWYGFAECIFRSARSLVPAIPTLHAISSAEYGGTARRPAYAVLDCRKIASVYGIEQRPWSVGLERVLAELAKH